MELSPIFYHSIIRPKWFTQFYIHNKIEKHFKLHDKKVLDFGTGTGANCTLCQPEQYLGIDPDEKRITFAKKLYPDYSFDVFKNDELSAENDSFDVILLIAVLHHIPAEQIRKYLKEFRRILKKTTGKIVAIEPCFFEKRYISNWFMKTNDNGKYILNEEGYHDLFKAEGFECKTIQKYKKCFLYNEVFFTAQ